MADAKLQFILDGEVVKVTIPQGATTKEIAALVNRASHGRVAVVEHSNPATIAARAALKKAQAEERRRLKVRRKTIVALRQRTYDLDEWSLVDAEGERAFSADEISLLRQAVDALLTLEDWSY